MVNVIPVPAFRDNYIWTLTDGRCAAVVDPGDAEPVAAYLAAERLELVAILATHHHADHVGGIAELVASHRVPVYGPATETIPHAGARLREGDRVSIAPLPIELSVLDIPGHTAGHIAYVGHDMLFCGDTLFACGCGRLFEGTPAQMVASLAKLAALPDETQVYCGHEYTLANLRFALAVEPHSPALVARNQADGEKRARNLPTLPSAIGLERATNPFLRCKEPAVIEAANRRAGRRLDGEVNVFATIREWKNSF